MKNKMNKPFTSIGITAALGLALTLAASSVRPVMAESTESATTYKTFQECVVAKGGAPLTKSQQGTLAGCRKENPKNKSGFESCLKLAGIPLPSAETRAAELSCRQAMHK